MTLTTQIDLENTLLKMGYDKKVMATLKEAERIRTGNADISSLPKGSVILRETVDSVEDFLNDLTETEMKKARKGRFYTHIIFPAMTKYIKEQRKMEGKQFLQAQRSFENPMALIPYLIAKEISKVMILPSLSVTQCARIAADSFRRAYFDFNPADDDTLLAMVQLIRSYLASEFNTVYSEAKKMDSTVIIVLKEEFAEVELDDELLVATLNRQYAAFKPMIEQPVRHKNLLDKEGGYFLIDSPLLKRSEEEIIRKSPVPKKFLEDINSLQNTKWSLNTEFHDWMVECEHPAVSKYFNTDIVELAKTTNKSNRAISSQIVKLHKMISSARIDMYKNKKTHSDERMENLARIIQNSSDQIDLLKVEQELISSNLSKAIGWKATLDDYDIFKEADYFYHPVFCDNRGRIYTYNTSLSFQGSSIAKALVTTHHKERLTEEGLSALYELLGGMVDGMSKAVKEERIAYIKDNMGAMFSVITHEDYSFIDLLDSDEILSALTIIHTLFNHFNNPEYTTGLLAYIDSTSSAIQIQALTQHCKQAASLTNLLPTKGDILPDAYKEVANIAKEITKEVADMTKDDLKDVLATFIKEYSPEDFGFVKHVQ